MQQLPISARWLVINAPVVTALLHAEGLPDLGAFEVADKVIAYGGPTIQPDLFRLE
jgi:hypothetical protein